MRYIKKGKTKTEKTLLEKHFCLSRIVTDGKHRGYRLYKRGIFNLPSLVDYYWFNRLPVLSTDTFRQAAKKRNDKDECAVCEHPLGGGGSRSATGFYVCGQCIADEDAFADAFDN